MMGTESAPFATLDELREWCERAPAGTSVDATELAAILAAVGTEPHRECDEGRPASVGPEAASWRERLWTVPSETRLGVVEVTEALGRPKHYVYAHTGPAAESRIPHRKLDGVLLFTAGELRHWIRTHEVEVVGGPMEPPTRPMDGLRLLKGA